MTGPLLALLLSAPPLLPVPALAEGAPHAVTVPAAAAAGAMLPPGDAWLASDKFQHALLSYAATAFTFAGLRAVGADRRAAIGGGMVAAGVAGVGKEVHDARRGAYFSARDLVADAVGIMLGYFLLREVR